MSSHPATGRTSTVRLDLVRAIGLSSAGAAWLHAAQAVSHGAAAPAEAAFFAALAAGQLAWACAVLVHPSRPVLRASLANVAVLGVWALSRTVGLPLGAHAGAVLPVGWSDGAAGLLSLAVVGGALALLRSAGPSVPAPPRPHAVALALVLPAYLALGLSAVGPDTSHDHSPAVTEPTTHDH